MFCIQDERLFDQGEANTNLEGVTLAKVVRRQLLALAVSISEERRKSNTGKLTETEHLKLSVSDREKMLLSERVAIPASGSESRMTCISEGAKQEVLSLPSSAQNQDSDIGLAEMKSGDSKRLLEGDECISTGSVSRLQLSADAIQQLQASAIDGLIGLASRLEECLQRWPPASPFLSTTEYETQCVECCRVLLSCHAITGLLQHDDVANRKKRLNPLLQRVKDKFYIDGQGSCSPLINETLQKLGVWCSLEEV